MKDAQNDEIKETLGENMYEEQFLQNKLTPAQVPLTVMYEMGWNKRSSGNKYNSISGHAFLIGGNSRKILKYRCMSKACRKCEIAKLTKEEPPLHECPKIIPGCRNQWNVKLSGQWYKIHIIINNLPVL